MEREKKERREGKEEGERDGEKRRGREGREEREKGEREREERDAISWLWGVNFLVSVPGCYTENDHMGLVFLMPLCT